MRAPVRMIIAGALLAGAALVIAPAGAVGTHYDASSLSLINQYRAGEGVGPISLPTDYSLLSAAEQGLVLTNLERVDRGLAPFVGLSSTLDAEADAGALAGTDPTMSGYDAGGNWASTSDPITSDYLWMYQDGPEGFNLDCTTTVTWGCYGHRNNILGAFSSPLLLGSASEAGGEAQVMASGDVADSADVYRWAQVTPFLPVGVSSTNVSLGATSSAAMSTPLDVWASGEAMSIAASVVGSGWAVSPASCALAAGHQCTLTLTYTPGPSSSNAVLVLIGPNGPAAVSLHGDVLTTLTAPVLSRGAVGSHLKVKWTTPAGYGGQVTGYRYETSINAGAWSVPTSVDSVASSASIVGAGNATVESIRVQLTGGSANSDWSNAVSFSAPGRLLRVSAVTGSLPARQFNVTWRPGADGGAAVMEYRVVSSSGATCSTGPRGRGCVLLGTAGAKSRIRVAAANAVGRGVWSSPVTVKVR